MEIDQTKAVNLINSDKFVIDPVTYSFPARGQQIILKLESVDSMNIFALSISRNRFELAIAYNVHHMFKSKGNIGLVRLDIDGHDHKNPSGEAPFPFLEPYKNRKVGKRHIHVFTEGYGLSWALPIGDSHLLRNFGLNRHYNFSEDHVENTIAFLGLIGIVKPNPVDLINAGNLL